MNKISTILFFFIGIHICTAQVIEVPVNFETTPVTNNNGADDPSLWVHPTNPDLSFFLGTDKKTATGQLEVYNLLGTRIGVASTGKAINNVDVRYNFPFNGERIDIVTANNVTDKTIEVWKINPSDQSLTNISGNNSTGLSNLYGYKMYHNVCTDKFYGFTSLRNNSDGTVYQYELFDNGNGGVDINLVRTINNIASLVEGITADDDLGYLYVGEENVAIWKYGANPEDGLTRTKMDDVAGPHLSADIEGLTIYYSNDSIGYLIASSQGDNTFAVYEREGDNTYLGSFRLVFGGVDGVETGDGVEVMSYPMGGYFNSGALIAHDYTNTSPNAYSNYKMVPWGDIATAMGLRIDTSYSPREMGPPQPKVMSTKDTICTNLNESTVLSVNETYFNVVSWSTNATAKTISVNQPGIYYATVYNECRGTLQTDTIEIFGDICTSIHDFSLNQNWEISPNPSSEFIYLTQDIADNLTFQLFDLTGKKIIDEVISKGKHQINIAALKDGSYLVKLSDKTTLLGSKMIVKTSN